jgi:hypothetical protein
MRLRGCAGAIPDQPAKRPLRLLNRGASGLTSPSPGHARYCTSAHRLTLGAWRMQLSSVRHCSMKLATSARVTLLHGPSLRMPVR